MADTPCLQCPDCDADLHPAEPCVCKGGRAFDGPDGWCPCEGSGWVWWETRPGPPIECPSCGLLSLVDVDEAGGHVHVREPYRNELAEVKSV